MSGHSTSRLRVNGDVPLGLAGKLGYLAGNALRNLAFDRPGTLVVERFAPTDPGVAAGTPSPSRALCEAHLATVGLAEFARAAGGVRMHEMGCGSGRAGRLAAAAARTAIRYRGFDVAARDSWSTPPQGAAFATFDGADFAATIAPDDNFFFSQSAAEHIPADLDYFAAVARACAAASGPTLQIHYLPSAACLRLYLFHGYRQYPAGVLARLARLQPAGARVAAVALGGPAAVALHWRWITWPALRGRPDRRDVDPAGYRAAFRAAAERDAARGRGAPAFWAFVVRAGF
ncbi:MAG: hypothetical protein ING29_10615 [Azospirillum sp.]|nr:hypothetical protein [Azospirillum sp.]